MANTTLKKGSSGSDVKKMQQSLIDAGYDVGSTGADGIYGAATEAAVRKSQQDNGLAVDGIAGDPTQGKLYGAQTASSSTDSPALVKTVLTFNPPPVIFIQVRRLP